MRSRAALAAIVVLALVAVVSAVLTVRLSVRSMNAIAAAQAAEAPEIARTYIAQFGSLHAAAPTIVKHVTRPGLHVVLFDQQTGENFSERGVRKSRFTAGPPGPTPGSAPPGGPGPPPGGADGPGPGDRPGLPDRPRRPGFNMFVGMAVGETFVRRRIPGGEILIVPDPQSVLDVLTTVGIALGIIVAIGIAGLWLWVRSVRREALRPLRETTRSLQRLAQRDFTPRTIVAGDGNAYAELAAAYNAAVEAVSAAFAERRQAETEMQRFIADAGHELRTPLTIVMGYLDIVEAGALADPAIAERIIGGMRNESIRMRKLIDKLIVLAHMETPYDIDQRIDIDVVSLAARVVESLEPLATAPIEIVGVPFAHVFASEDDLAEALTNIIENAIKYAPASRVTVAIERTADAVTVAITDRGPGMSTEEQRFAFERFYRGERRGEVAGSGLGLSIAKRAVERARGTIALQSVPGRGTTFTIALPQTPISAAEPPAGRLAHRS